MLKKTQTFPTSYLIKQLPTATVFIDKKFNIVHASDRWISIFSQHKVNVACQNLFKLFPELIVKWKKVLKKGLKENK